MKKVILSLLLFLVLILAAAIFLPYIFKDRIIEAVKLEANKELNAHVDFNNKIKLNIFKSFPDLHLGIKDLQILSLDSSFSTDTILYAEQTDLVIDLMKLYKEQEIKVKKLGLSEGKMHLEVNKESKENWDIFKESDEESEMSFEFETFQINNSKIVYSDKSIELEVVADQLNVNSKGEYRNDSLIMAHNSSVKQFSLQYDGVSYLHKHQLQDSGDILLDLGNEIYSFPKNKLLVNALPLDANALFKMKEDEIEMAIEASSSSDDIRSFFTLIPAIYSSEYTSMITKGKGELAFNMKGSYSETSFPAFNFKLLLENGSFKYPSLKNEARDIYLNLSLVNQDGILSHTELLVPKFHFNLANNPVDGKINIGRLMTTPSVDMELVGHIDLSSIHTLIPFENETKLSGKLYSDLRLSGSLDNLGNPKPGMEASGEVELSSLQYADKSMSDPLNITEAVLKFNNNEIIIPVFAAEYGKDDIHFEGKADNYLAYISDNGVLNADINWYSKSFDLNNYLSSTTANTSDSSSIQGTLKVPKDLNIKANAVFDELAFGKQTFKDIRSDLSINNATLKLHNLSALLFGGRIEMQGAYTTITEEPLADLTFTYGNLKIDELLQSVNWLSQFVPFAKDIHANSSAKLSFQSILNVNMLPKLSELDLGGAMSIEQLNMKQLSLLKKIDEKLGFNQFSIDKLQDIFLQFNIQDGNMRVDPFRFELDSSFLELEGVSKLDGSIDYKGLIAIPSSYFATQQSALNSLISNSKITDYQYQANDLYKIDIEIGGSYYKPIVKLNLKEIKKNITSSIKSQVKSEADKVKEKAKQEAENELNALKDSVNREAELAKQKMLDELERKKKEAEEKLRKEAEEKKKKLKEEAEKKLKDLLK